MDITDNKPKVSIVHYVNDWKNINEKPQTTERKEAESTKNSQENNTLSNNVGSIKNTLEKNADNKSKNENKAEDKNKVDRDTTKKPDYSKVIDMAVKTSSTAVKTVMTSAFGDTGGSMASVFTKGLEGLAAGGPVGAVVGVGLGAVEAATEVFSKGNEAFVEYKNNEIARVQGKSAETLEKGTILAANSEQQKFAYARDFGSEEKGENFLAGIAELTKNNFYDANSLMGIGDVLKDFGYDMGNQKTLNQIDTISKAGVGLDLSQEIMEEITSLIGIMSQSDNASIDVIKELETRGIDVSNYLSSSRNEEFAGKSREEIQEKIKSGSVSSSEVLNIVNEGINQDFGSAVKEFSNTFTGLEARLEVAKNEIAEARGEGYNEERKKGLEAELEYLEGDSADRLKVAESYIGQWEASLENDKERFLRESQDAALGEIEIAIANGEMTGAEAGRILAEAKIKAQAEYNASEGAQIQLQVDLDMYDNVAQMLVEDPRYWNANYLIGQRASQGIIAGIFGADLVQSVSDHFSGGIVGKVILDEILKGGETKAKGSSAAFGLPYVPYDNFPIMAHQGERLLTANQARQQDNNKTAPVVTVNVSGNSFSNEKQIDYAMMQAVSQLKIALGIT